MYCRNCGAELPDDAKFCTNCGCSQSVAPEIRHIQQYGTPYGQEKPSTYLGLAIAVTILCCIPFGVLAIVYASKVDDCWYSGRTEEALEYSRKARNWSVIGAVLSIVFWIVYVILVIAGVAWATWWDNSALYTTML